MSEWNGWKSHSSVDRDRKWKTFKFRPGIPYTIRTNQFHLTKNDRERLKLVSKMSLKKWNTNFRLEKQDFLSSDR